MSRVHTKVRHWLVTDEGLSPQLYGSKAEARQAILERYPEAQWQAVRHRQYLFYQESDGSGTARDYVASVSAV